MTTRFHLYFPTGTEHLLETAKEQIPNLSGFLIEAIKARLEQGRASKAETVSAESIFQKKFGDLESEAYIRQIFDDRIISEQALKNRLLELKRAHKEQFGEICKLFAEKFPGYAKITDEL
jgi:hypothetical protein